MSAYDLVIAGARIVDGCGNPWYYGDVAVRRDRIAAIGAPGALRGRRVIAADGRYVAPGFIDPHTHSDLTIMSCPRAESVVRQGVTTHVTGNCGMSPAPLSDAHLADALHNWEHYWSIEGVAWEWRTFAQYLRALKAVPRAINIGTLVGHGAVRLAVMGFAERDATAAELARMERLVDAAMRAGAFGMSSGLAYPPGCFAGTEELASLCKVVARYSGIYTSHIRGERETILAAVAEAITIGREASVPVEVSHNCPKWGAPQGASANLALMEQARREGQDVTTDNDVHTDLAPRLSRALPASILDLDHEGLIALLADQSRRAEVRRVISEDDPPGPGYTGVVKHGDLDRVVILQAGVHPELRGRSVAAIAAERGRDALDTYLDIIVEEDDDVVGIFDYMREEDIRALLSHPLMMVCSDGFVMPRAEDAVDKSYYWPCAYGEYPGILERYVRDEPVLRLEEAIRKMTSFPAQRFRLNDRGVLRPGLRADLVVFDLDRIRDRASNPFPHSYPFENIPPASPEGIDWVVVNGEPVIADGEHTGALPGRVLRRG